MPLDCHTRGGVPSLRQRLLWRADPVAWLRDNTAFDPDPLQTEVLRDLRAGNSLVWAAGRQGWGKSMTISGRIAHSAAHLITPKNDGRYLALMLAVAEKQARELRKKVRNHLIDAGEKLVTDSQSELQLANGARIPSAPIGATARGFSADWIVGDEVAYLEPNQEDDFLALEASGAARDAVTALISSPGVPAGLFHCRFSEPPKGTTVRRDPSTTSPRISKAWLERQRALLGEDAFAREYLAEFRSRGSSFVARSILDAVMADDLGDGLDYPDPFWPARPERDRNRVSTERCNPVVTGSGAEFLA